MRCQLLGGARCFWALTMRARNSSINTHQSYGSKRMHKLAAYLRVLKRRDVSDGLRVTHQPGFQPTIGEAPERSGAV